MDKKVNLVIFSGEYDKALAALVIANAALDMHIDVSLFFAFWGLMLIRDPEVTDTDEKSTLEKLMGTMTPKGPEELPLSRMNFSGVGKKMLEALMEENDAPSLPRFLEGARRRGARFYACKMSVEVMGFSKEELLPEVEIIDAKTYLKDALNSDMQLFI